MSLELQAYLQAYICRQFSEKLGTKVSRMRHEVPGRKPSEISLELRLRLADVMKPANKRAHSPALKVEANFELLDATAPRWRSSGSQ